MAMDVSTDGTAALSCTPNANKRAKMEDTLGIFDMTAPAGEEEQMEEDEVGQPVDDTLALFGNGDHAEEAATPGETSALMDISQAAPAADHHGRTMMEDTLRM